jgi:four helix bundle protein
VARDLKELVAWQRAHALRQAVWAAVQQAPGMERRFRAQWTDAAGSVCRNVAEGFGRRSHRDFARYLDQAISSLKEVEDGIVEAEMCGYLTAQQVSDLNRLARRTAVPIARLLRYLRGSSDPY